MANCEYSHRAPVKALLQVSPEDNIYRPWLLCERHQDKIKDIVKNCGPVRVELALRKVNG